MQNNDSDKKQTGLSWSSMPKPSTPVAPQMPVQPKQPVSSTAKYAGFVVAGVILGVLVAWGAGTWYTGTPATTTTSNSTTKTTAGAATTGINTDSVAMPAEGSDATLLIMSPQAAGTSVTISKAIVAEPTWIVVYENNNGTAGNALGAALFFPDRQSGTVELLRATVSGKSYLVAKQVDNGDHRFSLRDDQLLSEGGEVQWVSFDVQ